MGSKFVVAVKNSGGKEILPGKVLAQYRYLPDAIRDRNRLAEKAGVTWFKVGVFKDNKCVY